MAHFVPRALGWLRDLPDTRDYSVEHEAVKELLVNHCRPRPPRAGRRSAVTLKKYLTPPQDQLAACSSTAHACISLVEYFERKAYGRLINGSHRFLYRMARRLLHTSGNTGATLRATLKALRRFGLPPRGHWPETDGDWDAEPAAFLFSFAQEYQQLVYLRLDGRGGDGRQTLAAVKAFVAAGLPVAFGFTVFDSLTPEPDLIYPSCYDRPLGGQAVVAVGYDDTRRIRSERGALRVRNSWGPGWGDEGYGWLPYRYVLEQLAADFWTMLRPDWLTAGEIMAPI